MSTKFATGHVGINVTDLDRSVPFYSRIFGFETLAEGTAKDRRWTFLGQGSDLVLTLWQQSNATFSATTAGLHHLSFQVDSLADVTAAESALKELGAEFAHEGVVAHSEGASSGGIFFNDPDGIRLEIFTASGAEDTPAPDGQTPTCGFF
ncbi:VOC family protein [Nocardioides sp. 1609]|uniref:VOC family protein n=1 Tax=Nocardioides sp. 1609 TaxID=2508327 RepID=UPI0010703FB8|nr:VOC family protein [Nocardioides sp. 1609]